jgi:hypothetical protein
MPSVAGKVKQWRNLRQLAMYPLNEEMDSISSFSIIKENNHAEAGIRMKTRLWHVKISTFFLFT